MARRRKKPKLADLPGQSDPTAPLDSALFLSAAQPVLKKLDADLLKRAKESPAVTATLKARHTEEKAAERTADGFVQWQKRFIEQVSAAWLLSCVFARALEDRELLERNRIAGPGAADTQRLFFELAPSLTERDYLLTVFRELSQYPAAKDLFGPEHNPVWLLAPSAAAAKELLTLFRSPSTDEPAFRFGVSDTRFLGDLYQDLNENVRKRYALLQTPDFIEAFILDRTLEPAIEKFGLDDADLIDPTCGSGHFLLGAFDRFFEHVQRAKPGLSAREAAAEALDKVYGADINPFAVAIAKFRLTLSFLGKAAFDKISAAPKLPLHVAVADSLLYNPQHEQGALFHQSDARVVDWDRKVFALEEEAQARQVLHRRCAAVVGNPPYITPKDRVLRDRYRELYVSASGKYALSAPFCERFFHLARPGGLVGQITANSFMKREFGKSLIESFLSTVNLELLVSTAGAYIPGHGTPTLMMFGSNEPPRSATVRLVLSEGGEPAEPVDPSRGLVWSSIVEHWSSPGYVDEFVSVADCDRELLAAHPWSLSGGGALELKAHIEAEARESLGDLATAIGFDAIMGEDDLYYGPPDWLARLGVPPKYTRMLGIGENVRNWNIRHSASVLFPYDDFLEPALPEHEPTRRHFWRYKTVLERRRQFGKTTLEAGLEWFEYRSFYKSKRSVPTSIAYAFVSSRNHFVVDRGQRVFNQSAPVIKLPPGCSEDQYAALSCFLNSSISCFWMKQVSYPMGGDQMGDGGRLSATTWADRYQFAGRALLPMPLPEGWEVLANLGSALLQAAECRDAATPARVAERWFAGELDGPLAEVLNTARQDEAAAFSELVRLQECVDWTCYRLFGLCDDGLAPGPSADDIAGRRTFEHLLWQRTMGEGPDATWFERTGASPPDGVRPGRLQAQRIAAIGGSDLLAAVERPDFKRWWRATDYDAEIAAALRLVLEQAAEAELAGEQSLVLSESDVERRLREDSRVVELLELAEQFGGLQIAEVLATQAAPFLAAHRYTGKGLEKRREWEALWRSQAEGRSATPRTPKYSPKDMRSGSTWRLRGKLDVPRERFVSYPGCESDEDRKAAYCWAGLDHQQRAKALATLYYDRKTNEGWERDRLTPMLAGLLELQFWLELWHDKPSEDYGGVSPAEYYRSFVDGECQALGLTHDDLKAWRPPEKTKRGRKKSSKKSKKADQ